MENTAKNFALQLGALISLYVSIGALISLLFGIITILYPDPAQYPYEYEGAAATIRSTIAILIVFFPTYVVLTRLVNQIRRTEQGTYLTLTRWLIFISLLIGGAVLLGDLVATIMSFLNGEITVRFILKALTVLVVVGAAFGYYLADVRGYWQAHERDSIRYGSITAIIVAAAIVLGFFNIETPAEARERNIDFQQINDLQNMQSFIESYAQLNGVLPDSLTTAYGGIEIPEAPEGRSEYRYAVTNIRNFELCAEFAFPSRQGDMSIYPESMAKGMMIRNPYNWEHGAGEWCFERVLNPFEEVRP